MTNDKKILELTWQESEWLENAIRSYTMQAANAPVLESVFWGCTHLTHRIRRIGEEFSREAAQRDLEMRENFKSKKHG